MPRFVVDCDRIKKAGFIVLLNISWHSDIIKIGWQKKSASRKLIIIYEEQ